ncbi:glutamine--fructose-6-phosphate transaminase (isomerizing) [Chitinibacter sp. FCG-7]|uniref:Glutamine--fructose-6-phosphate aminotransferase [isomerizing] n=1 Tax=Chitinibacter mangrovi TaxID=3153927 RepID=A0AAU7F836_9NEIS
MNILLGAIASSDANALLQEGCSQLPDQPYHFAHVCAFNDEILIQQAERYPAPNRTYPVGLVCLGFNPHDSGLTLFRERVLVALLGHLENTEQIMSKLTSLGYSHNLGQSEEVIAALIDWYDRIHKNFALAVQLALKECRGYFALAAIKKSSTDNLYCATLGPSLFIGQNQDGCHFASDAALIRTRSSLLIELECGEMAELNPRHIACFDSEGKPRKKSPLPAHAAGHFDYHMQADIAAQPLLLAQLIQHYQNAQLSGFLEQLAAGHQYQRVLLLASGSSHHAAATAGFWIEQIAQLPVHVEYASEYRYHNLIVERNTLVIAISQSGETADTIAALRHAIQAGHQDTLAITNHPASTLSQLAKYQLMQYAGEEMGATSTKTFSTQLLCLYFVALKLAAGKRIDISIAAAELNFLPNAVAAVLNLEEALKQWAQQLAKVENLFLIGRNLHFPIALEAAQKMKEVSYIHAEGYPGGEIKHGPVTLINRTVPVVACLPWDLMAEKMLANLQEVRARQGEIYVLSDVGLSSVEGFYCIRMPRKLPLLNPVLYTIAFQLLSYLTAIARGNQVDTPRNLSKTLDKE